MFKLFYWQYLGCYKFDLPLLPRASLDVNECTEGTHNCDTSDRADCENTIGSFRCTCKSGYAGQGTIGTCKGNSTLIEWVLNERLY